MKKKLNIDISLNIDFPVFIAAYSEIESFFKSNESKFIGWIENHDSTSIHKFVYESDIIPDEDYRYINPYLYDTWFDDKFETFIIQLTYIDKDENEYSEYIHLSVYNEIESLDNKEYFDLYKGDDSNILTPEQKEMYIKRAQYRHRKNMHIIQEWKGLK